MKHNFFYSATFILLFLSCNDKNSTYDDYTINTGVYVAVKSKDGLDYLDKKNTSPIVLEKITVTSFGNNNKRENPNAGKILPDIIRPENFAIVQKDGSFKLNTLFSPVYSESSLKIDWNNGELPDTLTAELYREKNNVIYKKIFLNGKLYWEGKKGSDNTVDIIKGPYY